MKHSIPSVPTVSHEINNYLTIIYSQLEHIEHLYRYLSHDKAWIQLKEDFSSVFHLLEASIEEDLLFCSTAEFTPASDFLTHLYHSWLPRCTHEQIQFSIPFKIEPVELPATQYQLEHIFHNLLSNSFDAILKKASRDSYGDFIRIETELYPKEYQIKIMDSGCGMSQQQLSSILKPGVSYKSGGHGLGLTLVFEIMEAVNGHVKISSAPGRGTTIILYFPLSQRP